MHDAPTPHQLSVHNSPYYFSISPYDTGEVSYGPGDMSRYPNIIEPRNHFTVCGHMKASVYIILCICMGILEGNKSSLRLHCIILVWVDTTGYFYFAQIWYVVWNLSLVVEHYCFCKAGSSCPNLMCTKIYECYNGEGSEECEPTKVD